MPDPKARAAAMLDRAKPNGKIQCPAQSRLIVLPRFSARDVSADASLSSGLTDPWSRYEAGIVEEEDDDDDDDDGILIELDILIVTDDQVIWTTISRSTSKVTLSSTTHDGLHPLPGPLTGLGSGPVVLRNTYIYVRGSFLGSVSTLQCSIRTLVVVAVVVYPREAVAGCRPGAEGAAQSLGAEEHPFREEEARSLARTMLTQHMKANIHLLLP